MRAQRGLFTRAEAVGVGFTKRTVRYRVNRRRWEAVDFDVFRLPGAPLTWEQRVLAACLAGPAVASHRAAARLWDLPGFADAPAEVTAFRHRRRHRNTVVWHESFHLSGRDVTAVDDIPVTSAHRTIIDLAVVCDPAAVERALDAAIYRGLTDDSRVRARLDRFGRRRGATALWQLLDRRASWTSSPESVLETAFLQLVRDAGLPVPDAQHLVTIDGFSARVDFAYPAERIAIEVDGASTHTSRPDRQRDLRRQNRLILLGWQVLRFTWDDVTTAGDTVVIPHVREALSLSA